MVEEALAAGWCVAQLALEKGLLPAWRFADLLRAETMGGSRQGLGPGCVMSPVAPGRTRSHSAR